MKKILAAAAMVAALAGCSSEEAKTVQPSDLLHHRFVLTTFNGEAVNTNTPERAISLEFGENMTVSGMMCNRFTGQATLDKNLLTAKNLASTRMLCSEEVLNKLDGVIQEVLAAGAKVKLDDKTLTLSSDKNTLVYTLSDLMN